MKPILYILFFIILFCISCGQKKFDDEIKLLESLQKNVVKIQEDFNSLDSVKLNEISEEIPQKINEFSMVYMPDSINIRISTLINNYNAFRNYKATFNIQRLRIKKEIPYTISQLEHLLTDLKNNSLKTEDATKYFEIEKNAAIQLGETFINLKSQSAQKIKLYDSVKLVLETIMDSLRTDSLNVQAIRLKLYKIRTKRR